MATIIFDVDDTLYDQLIPFRKAFHETIREVSLDEINHLYRLNREKSDALFEQSELGVLPKIEVQVMRIQYACEQTNMSISGETALNFQKTYEKEQKHLMLYPEMSELLDKLAQNNHQLALLTNGAAAHQQKKIDQLGLTKWINQNQMFISGELGKMKPDKAVFKMVESALKLVDEKPIYIGDSFQNDVIGGKKVGWTVIWLNARRNKKTDDSIQPDNTIQHPAELLTLFEEWGYFKK
ncbi:putative hydrolase of the HAD superfamily [Carnobacterium iners]|uniref:Putative hydrolase of the HAD superfamily n=1 Tax=Carnobacterium iners TaxID=1073423 RepID=A0A1X7NCV2_9LACT|nr:HAD family hydrolase [Carnobacterium iners]SEK51429.1 putative hydrolase of the HAD superfamily [Carnobacterium iners]SMH34608.1 putative hydrolase of the HAD superfamily [Carnobacterium iners]